MSVEEREMLDQKIGILTEAVNSADKYREKPTVTIPYFVPDTK